MRHTSGKIRRRQQPAPGKERTGRHIVRHRWLLSKHPVLYDALPSVLNRVVYAEGEILPPRDGFVPRRLRNAMILAIPPFDGEWIRETLYARSIGTFPRVGLTRIGLGFRPHRIGHL